MNVAGKGFKAERSGYRHPTCWWATQIEHKSWLLGTANDRLKQIYIRKG